MPTRREQNIQNLVKRGQVNCVVCDKPVEGPDLTRCFVVVLVATPPPRRRPMSNLGLRHHYCTRSKYRPVHAPDKLIQMIEAMMVSEHKMCPVCKRSWVNEDDLDKLILASWRGVKHVLHVVCI